jgi:hypothetical protein
MTVSLPLVNFSQKKRLYRRTSIVVCADSHRTVNFIPESGEKEEDGPPPARKLANERDPLIENTTTLT